MKKSFAENPPSTSPVDDQDTPQPPKQTPQRAPNPSRQYQDITLGSSSSSSSTFNYNEHILNARQEEKEGTLLHKRSSNINNEFHSLLAPATSQEEFNLPDSNLVHMTAFKAQRTLSPTAKPRRDELVGTQFPQLLGAPENFNPRCAISSQADLLENTPSQVNQEQATALLQSLV